MSNLLKAEPIYQKVQNWEGLATTYYNIAYVLYNMKQYDKAIEYCEKSLRIREEKSFNKIGMAYSHVFLASIYSDTVKFDLNKAKYHYKRVIEICHETGDRITLLSALINTAKNYLNQNKLDSALNYAKQSLTLSRELGNQKFLTGTLFQLGDILIQLKKYKEAIPYFQEGYTISKEIEDLAFICNNAKGLATSYYSLGDYKNGYDNLFIYTKQKDELYNKENVQAISDMEAKYQNEKKQLEIEGLNKDKQLQQLQLTSQQKENESKNKLLIFGAISLLGISVFAFFAYHNFQKTKKQNLIIENQKQQVELKNEEIVHQKELVEEKATELAVKQKEIIDSINYAKRIQQAVLTGEEVWNKISPEHFILFMPKDIVSGDFYWAYHTPNNRSIFVLADCTGHGVPGGFMSMLGNSFLNEIIVEGKIFKADEILNKLRAKIISALEQKGATEQKDGMDMALCVWNKLDNTLEFAGANNPLWLVRNNELIEYKANKMPIGTYLENNKPFTSATINLQKGDTIYLTTDGYADQFGGENGKKLKYKTLIEHLLKINHQDMPQQKQRLEKLFIDWRGKYDQIDDVSVIGIRV
ncbi:MAG: tetratricopeptide repeat protein [Bacteroidia bacterium]|nr:tetratricopeptide repeat protein [Bacteroidia bacterium]